MEVLGKSVIKIASHHHASYRFHKDVNNYSNNPDKKGYLV